MKFNEMQLLNALKEYESGADIKAICYEMGIDQTTFDSWCRKYLLETLELNRSEKLEKENIKLKEMYSNIASDLKALKDLLASNR